MISRRARRLALAALPLILFVGMGGMFLFALESGRDPQALPSALQGRAAPATSLPPLEGARLADGGQEAGKKCRALAGAGSSSRQA